MKKLAAFLLALALSASLFALPAGAVGFTPTYTPQAEAVYIVNTDTNIIMYEKNSETPLSAASLVKVMTAAMLLDMAGDKLDEVTVTPNATIRDYVYVYGGSNADIRVGEYHTLRSMLYAMMLPSANEAALAVANYLGNGSLSNFVYMMNAKAKEIGCTGTVFTDACGLDEGNVTTARDMYLIFRYAMQYDVLKEVMHTDKYNLGENPRYPNNSYNIFTTVNMIRKGVGAEYYRSYAQGGKTGNLGSDWQNFVGWHTQNGETYISVVLHSPWDSDPYEYTSGGKVKKHPAIYETGMLMDWVFESFSIQAALDPDQPIEEIGVKYSADQDTLLVYPADELMTLLPTGGDGTVTQKAFELPESVAAPIAKGDVVGTVTVSLSGQVLGQVDLLAGSDVERSQLMFVAAKVGEFFSSRYFKVVLVLSVMAVVLYVAAFVAISLRNKRTNRDKIRRRHY